MTMMKMCSRKCPASGPMEAPKVMVAYGCGPLARGSALTDALLLKNAHDVASTAERLQTRKIKNGPAFRARTGEENRRLRGL
jgi:hypothetical protein